MFTGIIEALGEVVNLEIDRENLNLTVKSKITNELKVDQSLAHNGVCLTIVSVNDDEYTVTIIKESLQKSNLGGLKIGDLVNLERAMKLGDRLDGHIVQGHVDQTATCVDVKEEGGSWLYTFEYNPYADNITIEKGSITVNGVSLTVVNSLTNQFSVAIIPYTYNNTNFKLITKGSVVNLEFDMLGKYVAKLRSLLI